MSNYDPIARFYHEKWAHNFHPSAIRMLSPFFHSHARPGARVLDVCCGSGEIAAHWRTRGYRVFGFDGSLQMLKQVAHPLHVQSDARSLPFRAKTFEFAYATFDIVNHLLQDQDLLEMFLEVRLSLTENGAFVCDYLTESAYTKAWTQSLSEIHEDSAVFLRGGYNEMTRFAYTDITLFNLTENSLYKRVDTRVQQRCYPQATLRALAQQAGFSQIEITPVEGGDDFAFGREVLLAKR
jgi:ubiquinone/menaquinone biosynthesis C-methylase UbiE